jgi:hypothetical protein
MIPVPNPIPEPQTFDHECRQKGALWLANNPTSKRFPGHWQAFQSELEDGFSRRCGWLAVHITFGAVDHFLCKDNTFYDQRGRIVFTASKGLPGVGFTRPEWNAIKDMQSGTITRTITDTTLPTGPVERVIEYHAPYTRNNREQDYATVWAKLEH